MELEREDTGTGETRSVDTVLQREEPPVNSAGNTLPAEELAELWGYYRYYRSQNKSINESCALTGLKLGKSPSAIYAHTKKLRNTTALAGDILKSGAADLARRIIEKANVEQAIEVLTRSNIGVLAPKSAGEGGGGGGIFINVQAENLGAVKVGVLQGQPATPLLDPAPETDLELEHSVSTYTPEPAPTPEILTSLGAPVAELTRTTAERDYFTRPLSPRQQEAIERHKRKLLKARKALESRKAITRRAPKSTV